MDEPIQWTNLNRQEIAALLQEEGIEVSVTVGDQWLEKDNFRKRKGGKTLATGATEYRNEQFETIDKLKQADQAMGHSVMRMDT
jgi:argininosuccinate synthase